ncbi:hypothetical protein RJ640_025864 [Escallonia rubra]|uniref:Uncharacterized protein n=1 Tax=Escallonia rubra TaxID=112253 RepID=A0AA88QJR4_9ASTE|nr:hypothetical protein RJ640_025864 [Escallonia rubra]
MLRGCSPLVQNPLVVKTECPRGIRVPVRDDLSSITIAGNRIPKLQPTYTLPRGRLLHALNSTRWCFYSSAPLVQFGRRIGISPTPELGLFSLFFVLFTAVGAIFSLALISIPTLTLITRLTASMDKLSKVVNQEVPRTLFSLNLSSREIHDLSQQLGSLRSGLSKNKVAKVGTLEMVDAEVNTSHPPQA